MNSVLREVNEPRIAWAEGGVWVLTQLSLFSTRQLFLKVRLMNSEGWFQKWVIFWAKMSYMENRIWNGQYVSKIQFKQKYIKHVKEYPAKLPENSVSLHGLVNFWFCRLLLSIRDRKLILSTQWHSFCLCSLPAAHQVSYSTFLLLEHLFSAFS